MGSDWDIELAESQDHEFRTAERERQKREHAESLASRDKLQAFKDYVHARLDTSGVPHHPPGPHGTEGCRVGDRLEWLMGSHGRLLAKCEQVAARLRQMEELELEGSMPHGSDCGRLAAELRAAIAAAKEIKP